jgi:hypothetical protein
LEGWIGGGHCRRDKEDVFQFPLVVRAKESGQGLAVLMSCMTLPYLESSLLGYPNRPTNRSTRFTHAVRKIRVGSK